MRKNLTHQNIDEPPSLAYAKAIVLGAAMGALCQLISAIMLFQTAAPSYSYLDTFLFQIAIFVFTVWMDCSHIVFTPLVVIFVYHTAKELCRGRFSPQRLAWLFLASTVPLIFMSLDRVFSAQSATLSDWEPFFPAATADLCVITAMLPILFADAATRDQPAMEK